MIELTPQQQQFIDAQVAAGIFKEPTEVVGAALDLFRERQKEYERLKGAIAQVERGEYSPLDIEEVKRRGHQRRTQQ
jgi:putative addiction module CopG family antidote